LGSHIDARLQLLPEAAARHELRLDIVSCKSWSGAGSGIGLRRSGPSRRPPLALSDDVTALREPTSVSDADYFPAL
jgi:hypothetical protein